MTHDFVPDNDSEVKTYVRTLTDYVDDPDQLPEPKLDNLIDLAKLEIYNKTDSDAFYDDSGLGEALIGATAIMAKARVENYSVSSWSIGDQTIDVQGASDQEAVQFQQWNNMVVNGLESSSASGSGSPSSTTEYIGGWD